ncbi:MAG: hypothetical protein PUD64_03755, partial [Bacteroidales bacterium]|nr:hypothetical protein [Bacteroidales bacterium]
IPIRFFPTAVYALFIVLPVELDGDVSFLSLCLVLHSIAIMSMSFVARDFPESECKVTPFSIPHQIFLQLFFKQNYTKCRFLASTLYNTDSYIKC